MLEAAAEFLGAHAIAALLVIAVLVLLATAVLWRLIQSHSGLIWRFILSILRQLRVLLARYAPSLPMPAALARTFGIGRYLGVQAVLSIVVCIAAFAAFFGIADEIEVDEDLARFDIALAESLRAHVSPATLAFFSNLTRLGDSAVLIGLGSLVAFVFLLRRQWLHAGAWIVATSLGGALNWVLKALFERSRPAHDTLVVTATGWSFPSGHASGSLLVYGLLGYFVVRHTPAAWHIPTALLAVALVVFVGFSRVILQVHYFSDVLAGYTFAAAWVALWVAGLEAVRRATTSPADPST